MTKQPHCPYVKNKNDGSSDTCTATLFNKRSLNDMVPLGQADEITVVMSTAVAKAYAQWLVTTARCVAASRRS